LKIHCDNIFIAFKISFFIFTDQNLIIYDNNKIAMNKTTILLFKKYFKDVDNGFPKVLCKLGNQK